MLAYRLMNTSTANKISLHVKAKKFASIKSMNNKNMRRDKKSMALSLELSRQRTPSTGEIDLAKGEHWSYNQI